MNLVQGNAVSFGRRQGGISAGDKSATNGYLSREADDATGYMGCCEGGYSLMNITRIGGKQGAKKDEDFTGTMRWSMAGSDIVSINKSIT